MEAQPRVGYWARERDGAVSNGGSTFWTSWYLCRTEGVLEWLSWGRGSVGLREGGVRECGSEGEGVSECGTELKWGRRSVGLRQGGCWVQLLLKRNEGLGLDYRYIYIGYFCNFRVSGFYPGQVLSRVSSCFDKTWTRPGPASGFFKKNPYLTLFLLRPGKTWPIRVRPGRVLAGRAKIVILIWYPIFFAFIRALVLGNANTKSKGYLAF